MPNYSLNVEFDEKDLPILHKAKQKVIIVKHTNADDNENSNHVAWVTFTPYIHNSVDWSTEFALYASTSLSQNGATINKLSDKMASPKLNYIFDEAIFQKAKAVPSLGSNTFAVTNEMAEEPALTFGLAQNVNVNNTAYANHPINAILVPRGQTAEMTPIERIDVYLQSNINNSTVISQISSLSLEVEYSGEETEHTIKYDGITGRFVPVK